MKKLTGLVMSVLVFLSGVVARGSSNSTGAGSVAFEQAANMTFAPSSVSEARILYEFFGWHFAAAVLLPLLLVVGYVLWGDFRGKGNFDTEDLAKILSAAVVLGALIVLVWPFVLMTL